jgi:peptidoglycan-associated lipoprotein
MPRLVDELNSRLQDVFFGFDSSDLAPDALAVLHGDADLLMAALSQIPGLHVKVEGHCDERGSAEYNLGLGDRRARKAAEALHEFESRLPVPVILSYGKEAPQCSDATESCWQRNRRAHIVVLPN